MNTVPSGAALVLGKGKAAAITDADMARLADSLGCHPADLEAIAEVESSGFGWFDDGRIKILFEKHWFYKYLTGAAQTNAVKSGLARKNWISPAKGGYKDQPDANARYKLLERAIRVNEEGAYKSVSVGKFQIMGFNHKVCGHPTAKEMFEAFCESEVYQLSAFAAFLKNKGLVPALRVRDWAKIEEGYNGGGLNGAYARKMAAASSRLRAGKWKNYFPGSMTVSVTPPKPTIPEPAPASKDWGKPIAKPAPAKSGLAAFLAAILKMFGKGSK